MFNSFQSNKIFCPLFLNLLLVCFSVSFPAFGSDFTGQVVGVSDGDTITVLHDGKPEKIRLNGIDCPEKSQAFGQQAKAFTSSKCFGQEVTVQEHGTDKYGRTIGEIILADGQSLNNELVRSGHAWWYKRYSNNGQLGQLEQEAKQERSGLWAGEPTAPWDFRKTHLHSKIKK